MSAYVPTAEIRPPSGDRWVAKRGMLLLLLQMPVAAVVVGYGLRLVSLPVACFAVFVSSAAFPAWVSHRSAVSNDRGDPVHELHRYALHALLVVVTVTAVLTPVLVVAGVSVWDLWYDLGAELTAEPSGSGWSLVAGIVVYAVSAICMVTSWLMLLPGRGTVRRAVRCPLVPRVPQNQRTTRP